MMPRMTNDTPQPTDKEQKLAAALRDNLLKRKQQAKGRRDDEPTSTDSESKE